MVQMLECDARYQKPINLQNTDQKLSRKVAPVGLNEFDQGFLSKVISQSEGYVLKETSKIFPFFQWYRLGKH